MSMSVYPKVTEKSDRKLKLSFVILTNYDKVSSDVSSEYQVGQYAIVRLNFTYDGNYNINTGASFKIHNSQEHSNVQIKVTCKVNGAEKQLICPQLWSDSMYMHQDQYILEKINVYMFFILIEITVDTLIPTPWSSLHSDQSFTDFHLTTEDCSIAMHRVVMVDHSEVFKTMLSGEWKETAKDCLEVKGVSRQTLQHLKDYMYLGSLPEHDDLRPLLLIAKFYMMHRLEKACIDKVTRMVTAENYQDILEFAVDNRLYTLISSIVKNTPAKVVEDSEAINKELKLKALEE